jgi:hypothetical protein
MGNIDPTQASLQFVKPFAIAIILMNKTIARLVHDCLCQMGCTMISPT